jgi:pimeloyl-ACP methyl ester carboxylesterase
MIESSIVIDGVRIRYLEEGRGRPIVMIHGGSLGCTADIYKRSIERFASLGFRAIAYDHPGCGLSEIPMDTSKAYRQDFIGKFCKAMNLYNTVLIGHSQAGGIVAQHLLHNPMPYSAAILLCPGLCLPPTDHFKPGKHKHDHFDKFMTEPTIDEVEALLKYNLYNHELITDEVLYERYKYSVGNNFRFHHAHKHTPKNNDEMLWSKIDKIKVPLMFIYGTADAERDDAINRVGIMRGMYPNIPIHLFDNCKHMPHWDQEDLFIEKSLEFLLQNL